MRGDSDDRAESDHPAPLSEYLEALRSSALDHVAPLFCKSPDDEDDEDAEDADDDKPRAFAKQKKSASEGELSPFDDTQHRSSGDEGDEGDEEDDDEASIGSELDEGDDEEEKERDGLKRAVGEKYVDDLDQEVQALRNELAFSQGHKEELNLKLLQAEKDMDALSNAAEGVKAKVVALKEKNIAFAAKLEVKNWQAQVNAQHMIILEDKLQQSLVHCRNLENQVIALSPTSSPDARRRLQAVGTFDPTVTNDDVHAHDGIRGVEGVEPSPPPQPSPAVSSENGEVSPVGSGSRGLQFTAAAVEAKGEIGTTKQVDGGRERGGEEEEEGEESTTPPSVMRTPSTPQQREEKWWMEGQEGGVPLGTGE